MSEVAHRFPLRVPVDASASAGQPAGTVNELTVRRPVAGDLRATDGIKGEVAQAIAFAARLAGVHAKVIAGMDLVDFKNLMDGIESGWAPAEPASAIDEAV